MLGACHYPRWRERVQKRQLGGGGKPCVSIGGRPTLTVRVVAERVCSRASCVDLLPPGILGLVLAKMLLVLASMRPMSTAAQLDIYIATYRKPLVYQ
jgi:hypothetical protein